MTITEQQRAELETALDQLWLKLWVPPFYDEAAKRAYMRAIAIVRERPQGTRKVRSDVGESRVMP